MTCDSGIPDDCSGQNKCKTFGTTGYCVHPLEDISNVGCTDDCNCLGAYYNFGFVILGCRSDYKLDMNGEMYINTRFVKYYTDTCESNDMCGVG